MPSAKTRNDLLATTTLPRSVKAPKATATASTTPRDHARHPGNVDDVRAVAPVRRVKPHNNAARDDGGDGDDPPQDKFHLDKRAKVLLDADPDPEADDQLLTTREVAHYLGMSEQWLTLGRSKNYGPKFVRVGSRRLRYRKSDVRAWLQSRTYSNTSEYPARGAAS